MFIPRAAVSPGCGCRAHTCLLCPSGLTAQQLLPQGSALTFRPYDAARLEVEGPSGAGVAVSFGMGTLSLLSNPHIACGPCDLLQLAESRRESVAAPLPPTPNMHCSMDVFLLARDVGTHDIS